MLNKVVGSQFHGGDINRYGYGRKMCLQPASSLAARFAQYPPTDGHDIAALFRNGYEILRKHHAPFRLVPSNECFGAGESLRREIYLRLVVQLKFAPVQSMAQTAFYGLTLQCMLIHGGLEKLVIIATAVFGV